MSPIVFGVLIFCIVIPIIAVVVGNIRTKKQKKALSSTMVYDNQLLSLRGEAQREPWKDRDSLHRGKLYFCNKICLTIKNEGSLRIDTDVCKETLAINLDVRGKLDRIKVLDVEPSNDRLDLSTKDGMVLLDKIHLEPSEFLQIVFLGYFKVDLEELY
jgi:hypothetical protein